MHISDRLVDAITAAVIIHENQRDKGNQPYAWHVLRVGLSLLPDEDAAIAGLLHDAIEDYPYFHARDRVESNIRANHGDAVADAVRLLTRDKSVPYAKYIEALKGNPLALKVKASDLRDNLREDRIELAIKNGHDVSHLIFRYKAALDILIETGETECPQAPPTT